MTAKETYRKFCQGENSLPLFVQDWWLDAACGNDNWDVALIEKGGEVLASMPYFIKRKYGFKLLTLPPLTPFLGPWMRHGTGKYVQELSLQHKLMTELIDQLPAYDVFRQSWHYNITNWLPFYWKNYSQTTHYTYVIENITNSEQVFASFDYSKRKQIKKSLKNIQIKFDLSANEFYQNHCYTLSKQNKKIMYDFELFNRIYNAGYMHNAAKTIYAVDIENNLHGAVFIVWNENSAYYLVSTFDPDFRNSGASSLLVFEAIRYVADKTRTFDMEGSMIKGVENSFKLFGAVQKPVFCVSRTNSILLHTAFFARDLLKLLLSKVDHRKP